MYTHVQKCCTVPTNTCLKQYTMYIKYTKTFLSTLFSLPSVSYCRNEMQHKT